MGGTVLKLADGWSGDITGIIRTPYGEVTTKATVLDLTIDGNRDSTTGKIDGFFSGVRPGSPLRMPISGSMGGDQGLLGLRLRSARTDNLA